MKLTQLINLLREIKAAWEISDPCPEPDVFIEVKCLDFEIEKVDACYSNYMVGNVRLVAKVDLDDNDNPA